MPKNRIKVGLPIYGMIDPTFFQHWLEFQGELGRISKGDNAGLMTTLMPYIDRAENTIVDESLRCVCGHVWSDHMAFNRCHYDARDGKGRCPCEKHVAAEAWDYLVLVEHDNIIPSGWLERVITTYTEPIVGLIYFGKVVEDQRPIPAFLRDNEYRRLDYELVMEWLSKPGFYEVDAVGMGATAIRRDVFENWNHWSMPWFQTKLSPPNEILGQDVYFCMAAKKFGFKVFVDTAFTAEHIGPWRSNLENFIAANRYRKIRDAEKSETTRSPLVMDASPFPPAKPPESEVAFSHGDTSVDILVPPLE